MKDESNVFATLLLPSSAFGYSDCAALIYVYFLVLVCGLPMQMYMNHVAFIIIISYLGIYIGQHISYSYIIFILYVYMAKADVGIHHTSIHMHV